MGSLCAREIVRLCVWKLKKRKEKDRGGRRFGLIKDLFGEGRAALA